MQLESTLDYTNELLRRARIALSRKESEEDEVIESLRLEGNGRTLCPYCKYSSKKNKTSAFIKNGSFKCMVCGKCRRVA